MKCKHVICALFVLISLFYNGYSQKSNYISLGTKQIGIAFGTPVIYHGIVISPISNNAARNSIIRGIVLSTQMQANMVSGIGFSCVDVSSRLYGLSSSFVNSAQSMYGISTSLYHNTTRSNGISVGVGYMRGIHRGLSVSLVNYSETKGIKIAGFVGNNYVKGMQIGPVLMGQSRGVRVAFCNAKFTHTGVCIGAINSSTVLKSSSGYYGGTFGVSIGFINAGYNSGGYQIGIINSIRESIRPRIIQIGAINFAKVAENSLQIGIINSNGVGVRCKQIGILNIQRSNKGFFKILPLFNTTRIY